MAYGFYVYIEEAPVCSFLHQNNTNNNGIESVILVPLPFARSKGSFSLVVFSMCWFDENMRCKSVTRISSHQTLHGSVLFSFHSFYILHDGSSFVAFEIFSGMNLPNFIIFDKCVHFMVMHCTLYHSKPTIFLLDAKNIICICFQPFENH